MFKCCIRIRQSSVFCGPELPRSVPVDPQLSFCLRTAKAAPESGTAPLLFMRYYFFLNRYLSTLFFISSEIFLSIGNTGALITRLLNSYTISSVFPRASADI